MPFLFCRHHSGELPEVTTDTDKYGNVTVRAGEWSFDPAEDTDPAEAWAASKAWAAYALHLEGK